MFEKIGLVALALWAASAGAEEAPPLTLSEAVALALANSPSMAAAAAQENAAAAGLAEAKAGFRPRLELSAELARTTDPVQVFGGLLAQESFGPQHFDTAFLNEPDPLTFSATRIELRMPIFTGGRLAAVRGAAAAQLSAATAERDRWRQQLVRKVIDAYTGDLLGSARISALEAAGRTAEENRRLVADLHASGLVVEADLLQARVRAAELEEQLVVARAEARIRRASLNVLLGLPITTDWRLDEELPELLAPGIPDANGEGFEAAVADARRRRPDLAAAAARQLGAERRVALRRAERWPEVGAAASYGIAGDTPFGAEGSHWSAGLSGRLTIFDGGARRARQARSEAEAAAASAAFLSLEQDVALEILQGREARDSAAKRLATAGQTTELARRSLEIVRDRYREGLTQLVELLGAEASLTAAESRQLEIRRELVLAGAALALASGSL